MISNITKGKTIIERHCMADSVASKARGLMFSKKPDKGLVFVFDREKIISLHMFFVFFPIDVLFLDKRDCVVQIKSKFMPFTVFVPNKRAKTVIELPEGCAKGCSVGDQIKIS